MHHTQNMPHYLMSWNDWSTTWETKWISLSLPMCTQLFTRMNPLCSLFQSLYERKWCITFKKWRFLEKLSITYFEQKLRFSDNLYLLRRSFSHGRYAIFHISGLEIYISTSSLLPRGYVFTGVCLSGWRGCTHLHPIIFPLLPCSFWEGTHLHLIILLGGTPVTGTQVSSRGDTPVQVGVPPSPGGTQLPGGYPSSRGVPWPGLGYPLARTGWGTPGQDRMGYSPGQDWGTRFPSQDKLCLDRLCCGRYASFSFPQEGCFIPY